MSKKLKLNQNYKVKAVIVVLTFVILSGLLMIPIETVEVGECGGAKPIRLSLVMGDSEKVKNAKREAQDRRARKEEVLKQYPRITMGCSSGPTYRLYVI